MSSRPDLLRDCTVRDLMLEIKDRVPAVVMGVCIPDPDGGDSADTVTMKGGSRVAALGLAVLAAGSILRDLLEEQEEDNGL